MNMHRYLMSVPKFFGGEFRFEVVAFNKIHAKEVAREYLLHDIYHDNYMIDYLP